MFHSLTHHSSHSDIDSDKTQQVIGPCLGVYISVCLSCMYLSLKRPITFPVYVIVVSGNLYKNSDRPQNCCWVCDSTFGLHVSGLQWGRAVGILV